MGRSNWVRIEPVELARQNAAIAFSGKLTLNGSRRCSVVDIITSSATIGSFCLIGPIGERKAVNIEIHDAALEARIQKQLQST
jgi:hypothetical protein